MVDRETTDVLRETIDRACGIHGLRTYSAIEREAAGLREAVATLGAKLATNVRDGMRYRALRDSDDVLIFARPSDEPLESADEVDRVADALIASGGNKCERTNLPS